MIVLGFFTGDLPKQRLQPVFPFFSEKDTRAPLSVFDLITSNDQ